MLSPSEAVQYLKNLWHTEKSKMWPHSIALAEVFSVAQTKAIAEQSGTIGPAHLLWALLEVENEAVSQLLMLNGVTREEARLYAEAALEHNSWGDLEDPSLSPFAQKVLNRAFDEAQIPPFQAAEPAHLLIALARRKRHAPVAEILHSLGLDARLLSQQLASLQSPREFPVGHPLNDLTNKGKIALENAHAAMRASFCGRIATSHLLLGLLAEENGARESLEQCGVDMDELRAEIRRSLVSDGEIASPKKQFSSGAKEAAERARKLSKAQSCRDISTNYLLLALLDKPKNGATNDNAHRFLAPFAHELRANLEKWAVPQEMPEPESVIAPSKYIQVKWFPFLLGLAWWAFIPLMRVLPTWEFEIFGDFIVGFFVMLFAAFLVALVPLLRPARDFFGSYFYGWLVGIGICLFLGMASELRR